MKNLMLAKSMQELAQAIPKHIHAIYKDEENAKLLVVCCRSSLTGRIHSISIRTSLYNLKTFWTTSDANIYSFFPDLTSNDREFLLSGVPSCEWDQTFSD